MAAATLLLALLPARIAEAKAGEAKVTIQAPDYFVAGVPFTVRLNLEAPEDGATLQGVQLTQTAFTVDGKPLGEPSSSDPLQLKGGEQKTIEMDLASLLQPSGDFQLGWGTLDVKKVRLLAAAPKGEKYVAEDGTDALPAAELAQRWVLLRTNRGDILLELWPDVAPNHVRNFLDLAATTFYDETTFHRVIPGYMIQGGDPDGTGSGRGPRRLAGEFSDREHVRGVLSMARSAERDSASSQFFVMHADSLALDRDYTAFGKVVSGMAAVDRIATIPTRGQYKPRTPQVIERAIVVAAPADPASYHESK